MRAETIGVVLAGGLARRMGGGDKPLRHLAGRPLLAHVLDRLAPQVAACAINANGDPARFAGFGHPVIPDPLPDHPGPLAGILAALDWAATTHPERPWVLTVPGDAPFLPPDLCERLHAARAADGVPIAAAASGGRAHPPIAIWPVGLRHTLRDALLAGERRVSAWAASRGTTSANWTAAPCDPFLNVNTPTELEDAERLLAAGACPPLPHTREWEGRAPPGTGG